MSKLKKLTMARATIKGHLTRLGNAVTKDITVAEARFRQQRLEEIWRKFGEIQEEIIEQKLLNINSGEEEEREGKVEQIQKDSDSECMIFETDYYAIATRLQSVTNAQQQYEQQLVQQVIAQQPPQNPDGAGIQRAEQQRIDIKLPVLALPEFKGDFNEWLLFKDAFQSMIHDNVSLSAIQKFQYLRSALKEEALQVIGGLDTSAENYVNAWELLKNNYENTKLLVNTHLNKLLDFPAVAKDKPATMRQLIVHIRTHLKALRTLLLPVEHWDDLLIHMVKSKLDYNAQRDWEQEANRNRR
ncbi:uncharacterized protein [Neodiprion pinetum]|uniref:uncharacterized protein n=1 Tax=Neodiprion pinetum TaxID=441929 RepID=UPI003712607A